jgi:hypothetical protein
VLEEHKEKWIDQISHFSDLAKHRKDDFNKSAFQCFSETPESGFIKVFFPVFSDPTAENPWYGLRAMRNRPPTLVEASRQDR